jgi:hypothetical protein
MSNFDAQQQKLDEQLDKHLNICRGLKPAAQGDVLNREGEGQ